MSFVSTLELKKVEIYLLTAACDPQLLKHIKPNKTLVLNKQFAVQMEELEIELGAKEASNVCVNFYFADRYFQWQHQFEQKPEVLEELVKDGILVKSNKLEKMFIGDDEVACQHGACLVSYDLFDFKKELNCKLIISNAKVPHTIRYPQVELTLEPTVDFSQVNNGLVTVSSFNCSAKLANQLS